MGGSLVTTLDIARRELRVVESPPNSNDVTYARWYGMNKNPWCAMFVSWVLAHAANVSGYRHASVAASLGWARNMGRHTAEFRSGYICCRINNGSWSGPGHTGIVEAVHSDGSVTTIEGNTSPGSTGSQRDGGGVWRRRRPKSYWNRQCIRIDYDEATTPPPIPPDGQSVKCPDPGGHPTIKRGAKGRAVNHLQHYLIVSGAKIAGDGDFGPATYQAVVNHQVWLRNVKDRTIVADGIVGPKTWQAIHNWADGMRI